MKRFTHFLIATLAALSFGAHAQEATIRKNLAERLPSLPKIDVVRPGPSRACSRCA